MGTKFLLFCLLVCIQNVDGIPIVNSVSPGNGDVSGGNIVTISGSGFTSTTNVDFGFRAAVAFGVLDDTTITATVPAGTPGAVDIRVTALAQISPISPQDLYVYTTNAWEGVVSVITPDEVALFNTGTNTFDVLTPMASTSLTSVITPDGARIYTGNTSPPGISVIDVATNAVVANIPTSVGPGAFSISINPSGTRVYLSNNTSGFVTVLDTLTNTVVTDVFVGVNLGPIVVTPDGSTVYVSNFSFGTIIAIDTSTNTVGNSISTGTLPAMISITPDGTKAFVSNLFSDTISVIDLGTQTVTNTIILPSGSGPYGSTILPNGSTLYAININTSTVTVIDVLSENIITTIPLTPGIQPFWVVSTPDSKQVYIINLTNDTVIPVDVATNTVGIPFGGTGGRNQDLIMAPDPSPVAAFTATAQPIGVSTLFDATASLSPIGTITSYAWDFGDGTIVTTVAPFINHTYTTTGNFIVTLIVTNSAGTSTDQIFSSRYMSNNGGDFAMSSQIVEALPLPPINIRGFQKRCEFLSQTDIVNVISWSSPVGGGGAVDYKIFRDSSMSNLVFVVSGDGLLEFYDHNRRKNRSYSYYIVSVSSTGGVSVPASITIP